MSLQSKHPNIQVKCKYCNNFSVQFNHCKKHYDALIIPQFGKFMEYLMMRQNLSQGTTYSYVSVLSHIDYKVLNIIDENFMHNLRLEMNNNAYNFTNRKTINKNRAAIKAWLTYKAKTQFIPEVDNIFIINASINYAQRAKIADSDEQVEEKVTYKYVDYNQLFNYILEACKYKVVSIKDAKRITGKSLYKLEREGASFIKKDKRVSKVILQNPDNKEVLFRKTFLMTSLVTATRASELVWAYTKSVSKNDIQVMGKRSKLRNSLVNKATMTLLEDYIRVFEKKPDDRLFVFEGEFNLDRNDTYNVKIDKEYVKKKKDWEGLQISIKEYYYVKRQAFLMNRLFKELFNPATTPGCSHLTPHMMRHSLATHLADKDVPLPIIQKILGHSDIKTTQIYAKIKSENVEDAYKKVMDK